MKNNKGFSLVELIVVIAIMAILAAVAVVGLSVYIPKAQQANDKQLVSDIEYALNLYYQGNPEIEGGFVVITTENTTAGGSGIEAMNAVFGEDWASNKLAYEKWDSNAMKLLGLVGGYEDDDINTLMNSTFLGSNVSTSGMVDAVSGLLNQAVVGIESNDKQNIMSNLKNTLGLDNAALEELANDDDVTVDQFKVAASNALVGFVSDKMNNTPEEEWEEMDSDPVINLMYLYANAYAYSQTTGDPAYWEAAQAAISKAEQEGGLPGVLALGEIGADDNKNANWKNAVGATLYDGYAGSFSDQAEKNNDAIKVLMGAVSEVAKDTNAQELLNDKLFTDADVVNQIDAYKYAVQVKAAVGDNFPAVGENDIVIFLLEDGTIFSTINAD